MSVYIKYKENERPISQVSIVLPNGWIAVEPRAGYHRDLLLRFSLGSGIRDANLNAQDAVDFFEAALKLAKQRAAL